MTLCECGCGQETAMYRGKPRRFIHGHHRKGKTLHEIPTCRICGETLTEDNWYPANKNKCYYICRSCSNAESLEWRKKNPEKTEQLIEKCNRKFGRAPLNENRECPKFLGEHVAERVLRHVFKDVVQMPANNHGFDFICNHGKRIDAKSSCIHIEGGNRRIRWQFHINKNTIADYFVLLAFDNRNDVNPLHVWMFPGHVVNKQTTISISESTIDKWDEYRLDIDKVISCCNTIREVSTHE